MEPYPNTSVTPYAYETTGECRIDLRATCCVQTHLPMTVTHRFDQCGSSCPRLHATQSCEAVLNRSDLRVAGDDTFPVFQFVEGQQPTRFIKRECVYRPTLEESDRKDHRQVFCKSAKRNSNPATYIVHATSLTPKDITAEMKTTQALTS